MYLKTFHNLLHILLYMHKVNEIGLATHKTVLPVCCITLAVVFVSTCSEHCIMRTFICSIFFGRVVYTQYYYVLQLHWR